MLDIINQLYEEIVIAIALGTGSGVLAYFRKMYKTQQDLCKTVDKLQKTIIILAKAVDRQSNRLHPEANSDLDDLVKELLDKN